METKEIKLKRGPKPGNPEHKATEMLGIRVTASVKNIYQSLADNFGISETDLFYQYVHISKFLEIILPLMEKEWQTSMEKNDKNDIIFIRLKTMIKAFSLISDLENQRPFVRGKNQKTNIKQVSEIEDILINHLKIKHNIK